MCILCSDVVMENGVYQTNRETRDYYTFKKRSVLQNASLLFKENEKISDEINLAVLF